MSYQPSVIERLQLDMGAVVAAAPYFANVPVNILRPRAELSATMIQNNINQALQGVQGVGAIGGATILICMPEGEVPYPEAPGPDMRLICKVQVVENPLINMGPTGTLKSAEDLTLAILNLFQGRYWQDIGSTMVAHKDATRPLLSYLEKNYVAYECRLQMRMGLSGALKTPLPAINGNSETGVTFTGVGAIWYTLDGSYPTPTNAMALQWNPPLTVDPSGEPLTVDPSGEELLVDSAPIFPEPGTLVRAVAYKTNQQASDLAAKTIS